MTKVSPHRSSEKKPSRRTTPFLEFAPYEDRKTRNLKFDVNALADFEQETGMGFAQLLRQKAMFASARAMLWAGLKHEDRGLTIEYVGEMLSDYLRDEEVEPGKHNIDAILTVAIAAAVQQGALGRQKPDEPIVDEDKALTEGSGPNAQEGQVIDTEAHEPTN